MTSGQGLNTNFAASRYFAETAETGEFKLPVCTACGNAHWYPRPFCPHCQDSRLEWRKASGRGHIYAFSIMRRADAPFALAYVQLDEGPMMLTNLVAGNLDDLRIGDAVELTFRQNESGSVPVFRPANPKHTS